VRRAAAFFRSMAGRIFVVLLLGVVASASVALSLADAKRRRDLDRAHLERAAERTQDFIHLLDSLPGPMRARLGEVPAAGVSVVTGEVKAIAPAPALGALLTSRTGTPVTAETAPAQVCLPPPPGRPLRRPPDEPDIRPPQCWLVGLTLKDGARVRLAVDAPPLVGEGRGFDPFYLAVLAVGVAVLALIVARMAAAPINRLGRAARELGGDLDRPPLEEAGPTEVREAAHAFNAMQTRLRRSLSERTQMLAAITHDLQTPLTRLRLRLEKVADEDLRARLLGDLGAMQSLVREGLELARSAETTEPFAVVDVDAMLESLVEDAVEVGGRASLAGGCGADVRARPLALRRCLSNLVDNALKYGGDAEVSAVRRQDRIAIVVRDHGPGIPPQALDAVFDPFVRLESSRSRETGGAGLGLAIARALAERCEASLSLANHPAGGLEAVVSLPAAA
jgi:signal transduction histidine kinase